MHAFTPLVSDTLRVLLVLTHLVAVAVAVGLVFWQDIALLRSRHIDPAQFRLTSVRVTQALIVLWITGLVIIDLDTGFDLAVLSEKPKILAKLTVVVLLSLNGWVLHRIAFPALAGTRKNSTRTATLVAVIGAISAVSWLYAIFLGVARPLAGVLGYAGFMGIYAGLLLLGMATALSVMRPRIENMLRQPADPGVDHPERRQLERRQTERRGQWSAVGQVVRESQGNTVHIASSRGR